MDVEGLDEKIVPMAAQLAQHVSTLIGPSRSMQVGDAELRKQAQMSAPVPPRLTNELTVDPDHPDAGYW